MAPTATGALAADRPTSLTRASQSGHHFDVAAFESNARHLAATFKAALPFPHVVADNLVLLPADSAKDFPDAGWPGWSPLGDAYQRNKFCCNDIDLIPPRFAELITELSSPRFLRALETVTGIPRLLPDPYLNGGGLHLSGPGGILSPHTDFHHYRALNLYRRINLLIYFNEGWDETDGGCLDLMGESTEERIRIVPQWGRSVIFATDDRSVHGFPVPVADGHWRRSIALYYYTAADSSTFGGDATTLWREHGEHDGFGKARLVAYKGLINLSRSISILAHLVNPNQGAALLRTRLRNRRG